MALEAACSSVRTFEAAVGTPFSLPKLDLVGIPNFAAGAMENWCAPAAAPGAGHGHSRVQGSYMQTLYVLDCLR
jgi:hypothetical protein